MSEQLTVGGGQLADEQHADRGFPVVIRVLAHFFSYVFHPLFVPLYVVYFLVYLHPSYLSGFSDREKIQVLMIVVLNAVFFPLISVLLLKGVGFIDSIFLRTQKDRIIPYIASGIFFFWTYHVFRQQQQFPSIFPSFFFGILLSSSAALLANIYFKISMHAIGMGGLLGLFLIIMLYNTMLMTWPLCIAILITGLVCTSRLIASNHTPKEIYRGLFLGLLCQLVAALVML
jgi:hypothetical protein